MRVYPRITGALCANTHPGSYSGQDAYNDMLPVIERNSINDIIQGENMEQQKQRKYILRRLMPVETLRLQGFPDDWCDTSPIEDLTDEEVEFWEGVRKQKAEVDGKAYKPLAKKSLIKWLNSLGSDSSIYRAAGNSLAIPCAVDVIGRIARFVENENRVKAND